MLMNYILTINSHTKHFPYEHLIYTSYFVRITHAVVIGPTGIYNHRLVRTSHSNLPGYLTLLTTYNVACVIYYNTRAYSNSHNNLMLYVNGILHHSGIDTGSGVLSMSAPDLIPSLLLPPQMVLGISSVTTHPQGQPDQLIMKTLDHLTGLVE